MHYTISYTDPDSRFIQLQFQIDAIHQDLLHIQLPAWRPGRYELQNYAKNIRKFSVTDPTGKLVLHKKITKDKWELNTAGIHSVIIRYEYFANQPDAGASYLCSDYLYINPVNCMMYVDGREDEPYTLDFELPTTYHIACQLEQPSSHQLIAPGFDALADSPLIASPTLEHHSFLINDGKNTIHIWFQGKHPFDIEKLKADTRSYAAYQSQMFGDMPCAEYHFLYLMHNYPFRHGVEHMNSTVIAMGQTADQTVEEYYHDLLAISCHELFHLWNVKRIRPADMLPYDFTKENYSTLGYVYEGVTTYYGDLLLMRCGVWSEEMYLQHFSSDLKRHFDNAGRFNYSVAESSWDTWLDGYSAGIPDRKVSIYVEGMIAALLADIMIIEGSEGKYRLDDVMKTLYQHDAKNSIGYTEDRYKSLLEQFGKITMNEYRDSIIHGKGNMETWLMKCLPKIGYELVFITKENNAVPKVQPIVQSSENQENYHRLWSSMN